MALNRELVEELVESGRNVEFAGFDDPVLGPLRMLPGIWKNTEDLEGYGFNMMALPFREAQNGFRILMNQYEEELNFSVVDKGVPNRGRTPDPDFPQLPVSERVDQTIVALNSILSISKLVKTL